MPVTIEYYYALASPWAYLGHSAFMAIIEKHGARVDDLLIDYETAFHAAGTLMLPQRPALRKKYRLLELKRWSAFRAVPLVPQPRHYRGEAEEPDESRAVGMCLALKRQGGDSMRLAYAVSRGLWAEERDAFRPEVLREIASDEGFDAAALLEAAETPDIATQWRANTDRAVRNGVFGMPTYRWADDPSGAFFFWGQDRLEFVDRALATLTAAP